MYGRLGVGALYIENLNYSRVVTFAPLVKVQ
jgi:hypothetical protein